MSRKSTKGAKAPTESLKKEDVVLAVVIVDSFKGGFQPITDSIPTALIPVVNIPLLDYTLKCLSLSSVQEVILFCCSHADLIKQHIKQKKWDDESSKMSITIFVSETCRSVGDVMRDLDAKAVLRSDFILVSGNMVANLNLLPILQQHREVQKKDKGAVMTMVYKAAGAGHTSRSFDDETILAVDASTGRVLAHHRLKSGSKKRLDIPLETYVDRARVELRFNLQDAHVCICSSAVPPLFSDNFDFQTQDDFIRGLLMNEEILASTIYWHVLDQSNYAAQVSNWHMYQAVSHDVIYRWVYPFVPDTPISWESEPYMFLRRNVYKQKSVTLGKGSILEEDVVVAEKSNIGENTHISQSIIGRNCHIGNNVSIYNSYIWDNVTIGDNCNISFSIIAHQSIIGKNVKLNKGCTVKFCKGCIIGPGVVLPDNCNLQGSTIISSSQERKGDGDQDEEYKLEKIAEKAYSLQVIKSESDSEEDDDNQQLQGFWLHSMKQDDESDSENDFSDSEKSDRASPIPDDTHLFYTEVIDSLTRGYDDKLHPDNLILEINSSRYAYNVSVREVNYFVVKAILTLPIQARSADSTQKYLSEFNKLLRDFLPILQNYVRNPEAQNDCLQALEDMATSTDVLREGLIKLLHLLYEKDILTEDVIVEWHKSCNEESETAASLRKQVAPFIQWLEEADEESDESGSD